MLEVYHVEIRLPPDVIERCLSIYGNSGRLFARVNLEKESSSIRSKINCLPSQAPHTTVRETRITAESTPVDETVGWKQLNADGIAVGLFSFQLERMYQRPCKHWLSVEVLLQKRRTSISSVSSTRSMLHRSGWASRLARSNFHISPTGDVVVIILKGFIHSFNDKIMLLPPQECHIAGATPLGMIKVRPSMLRPLSIANIVPKLQAVSLWEVWAAKNNYGAKWIRMPLKRMQTAKSPIGFLQTRTEGVRLGRRRFSSSSGEDPTRSEKNIAKLSIGQLDEWNWDRRSLWISRWPAGLDLLPYPDLLVPLMEEELKHDCLLTYNTLFPRINGTGFRNIIRYAENAARKGRRGSFTDNFFVDSGALGGMMSRVTAAYSVDASSPESHAPSMDASSPILPIEEEYGARVGFLKRVFLFLAFTGVFSSEIDNFHIECAHFPYPLASVLCHGARLVIRLEDVECQALMNFLLFGKCNGVSWKKTCPRPLIPRIASTHDVSLDKKTGCLIERKLNATKAVDVGQTLIDGLYGKHMGLDIPLGGVGNPTALMALTTRQSRNKQSLVGIRGDVIRLPKKKGHAMEAAPNIQGGHVYFRTDNFGTYETFFFDDGTDYSQDDKEPSSFTRPVTAADIGGHMRSGLLIVGKHLACSIPSHCPQQFKRVVSCPDLSMAKVDQNDFNYVKKTLIVRRHILPLPPSVEALALLLHGLLPTSTHLNRADLHRLHQDLVSERAQLLWEANTVSVEYIFGASVTLCWEGFTLVETHCSHGACSSLEFQMTSDNQDSWAFCALELLDKVFGIAPDVFKIVLCVPYASGECVTTVSLPGEPFFNGAVRVNRTVSKITYNISKSKGGQLLSSLSLPVIPELRVAKPHQCDFWTCTGNVQSYWVWRQQYEIFGTRGVLPPRVDTNNDSWLEYSLNRSGRLQEPPNIEMLASFLQQYGIYGGDFTKENYTLLHFYQELVDHECSLFIQHFRPYRLIQKVYVCLQWNDFVCVQQCVVKNITPAVSIHTLFSLAVSDTPNTDPVLREFLSNLFDDISEEAKEERFSWFQTKAVQSSETNTVEYRVLKGSTYRALPDWHRSHIIAYRLHGSLKELSPTILLPPQISNRTEDNYFCDFSSAIPGTYNCRIYWKWMHEREAYGSRVNGYYELCGVREQRLYRYAMSSILMGIEGSRPGTESPFGHKHDASGKSASRAAGGNCKWRLYRRNNASKVPADLGGIKVRCTQNNFTQFQDFMRRLDPIPSREDVLSVVEGVKSKICVRDFCNKRYEEKQYFRDLLCLTGKEAYVYAHKMYSRLCETVHPYKVQYMPGNQSDDTPKIKSIRCTEPVQKVIGGRGCYLSFSEIGYMVPIEDESDLRALLEDDRTIDLTTMATSWIAELATYIRSTPGYSIACRVRDSAVYVVLESVQLMVGCDKYLLTVNGNQYTTQVGTVNRTEETAYDVAANFLDELQLILPTIKLKMETNHYHFAISADTPSSRAWTHLETVNLKHTFYAKVTSLESEFDVAPFTAHNRQFAWTNIVDGEKLNKGLNSHSLTVLSGWRTSAQACELSRTSMSRRHSSFSTMLRRQSTIQSLATFFRRKSSDTNSERYHRGSLNSITEVSITLSQLSGAKSASSSQIDIAE